MKEGLIKATITVTYRRPPSPLGRRVGDEGLGRTPNPFKCVREMVSLSKRNHLSLRDNEYGGAQALAQPSPKGRGLKKVRPISTEFVRSMPLTNCSHAGL